MDLESMATDQTWRRWSVAPEGEPNRARKVWAHSRGLAALAWLIDERVDRFDGTMIVTLCNVRGVVIGTPRPVRVAFGEATR